VLENRCGPFLRRAPGRRWRSGSAAIAADAIRLAAPPQTILSSRCLNRCSLNWGRDMPPVSCNNAPSTLIIRHARRLRCLAHGTPGPGQMGWGQNSGGLRRHATRREAIHMVAVPRTPTRRSRNQTDVTLRGCFQTLSRGRVAACLRASHRQEGRVRGPKSPDSQKSLDSQEFSRLNVLSLSLQKLRFPMFPVSMNSCGFSYGTGTSPHPSCGSRRKKPEFPLTPGPSPRGEGGVQTVS